METIGNNLVNSIYMSKKSSRSSKSDGPFHPGGTIVDPIEREGWIERDVPLFESANRERKAWEQR